MSIKNTAPRSIAAIVAAHKAAGRADLAKAARDAYEAETRRCAAVVRLCNDAGLPDRAIEMIESRRTADEVTELLRRAAVNAQWDRTINSSALPN